MRRRSNNVLDGGTLGLVIVTSGALIGACSAPPVGDTFASGAGAANGQGGANSGSSTDASSNSSSGNGGMAGGSASSSSGSGAGGACASTAIEIKPNPFGMYLMTDRSGSMQGTRWTDVTNAIKAFIDQPSATGIGVGMQFFPVASDPMCPTFCTTNADCGLCGPCMTMISVGVCSGSAEPTCDVTSYSTPAVSIAKLPNVAPLIKNSLDATSPSGGTPTSAALDGAIQYTKQWTTMNTNAVGVVVFATDGEPSHCDLNLDNINAIAAAGLKNAPSVKTYVIGVGSNLTSLNGIAAAGGTGQAFLIDANTNAQQEFLQAMNAIRLSAQSCTYAIPPPPSGQMLNYSTMRVQYTPSAGVPELLQRTSSLATCPPNGKAWYYDNDAAPQQILLCPNACNAISADSTGRIEILVDCTL